MTQEIRIKLSERMDNILNMISQGMGIKKTEYVKSLIMEDIRKRGVKGGEVGI